MTPSPKKQIRSDPSPSEGGSQLPDLPNPASSEPVVVAVDEEYARDVDAADLARAVAAALAAEQSQGNVTLVVTSDDEVAAMNARYRRIEGPTDVLAFAAQEPTPGFVSAPEMAAYLGDIVIALPFARQQAAELGRSLADELRLLAVHGTLHLLGYDHADPYAEARMWARQDAILSGL